MDDPQELANRVVTTLGGADSNTAHTALEIAKLLLIHRESAARQFIRDQSSEQCGLDDRLG
jgi:hypothetical protein